MARTLILGCSSHDFSFYTGSVSENVEQIWRSLRKRSSNLIAKLRKFLINKGISRIFFLETSCFLCKNRRNVEQLLSRFTSPRKSHIWKSNRYTKNLLIEDLLRRDIQPTNDCRVCHTLCDRLKDIGFLVRMMFTNRKGDKSPNFCGCFHNFMICNHFCNHAGLRDMLHTEKWAVSKKNHHR